MSFLSARPQRSWLNPEICGRFGYADSRLSDACPKPPHCSNNTLTFAGTKSLRYRTDAPSIRPAHDHLRGASASVQGMNITRCIMNKSQWQPTDSSSRRTFIHAEMAAKRRIMPLGRMHSQMPSPKPHTARVRGLTCVYAKYAQKKGAAHAAPVELIRASVMQSFCGELPRPNRKDLFQATLTHQAPGLGRARST
jgi:hypothetical protein